MLGGSPPFFIACLSADPSSLSLSPLSLSFSLSLPAPPSSTDISPGFLGFLAFPRIAAPVSLVRTGIRPTILDLDLVWIASFREFRRARDRAERSS